MGERVSRKVSEGRLKRLFKSQTFRAVVTFVVIIVIFASIFSNLEGLSFFDAVYWAITTSSTVGYGDYSPLTTHGKLLAMVVMVSGVALLGYLVSILSNTLVSLNMNRIMGLSGTRRKNHVILLGWNKVAMECLNELITEGEKVVVVSNENDPKINTYKGVQFILGRCEEITTLEKAGVRRAKAVIVAMREDADVILAVSKVRIIDKEVPIYGRIDNLRYKEVAIKAGCHRVVSPSEIGGDLLYSSLHKPAVIDWVSEVITAGEGTVLSDFAASDHPELIGKKLSELNLPENKVILAYDEHSDTDIEETLPKLDYVFNESDSIVLIETLTEKQIPLHRTDATRTIKKKDKVYICGYNQTLLSAALTFSRTQQVTVHAKHIPDDELVQLKKAKVKVVTAAISKQNMKKAKIESHDHIIINMDSDSDTVLTSYVVQSLNHKATLSLVIDHDENKRSAIEVGADQIISPPEIGGQLLAKALTRPIAVEWIMNVTTHTNQPHLQERVITKASGAKTIGDIKLKKSELLVGIEQDNLLTTMPKKDHPVKPGDIIILVEQ